MRKRWATIWATRGAIFLILAIAFPAQAGVYYSNEVIAELPAQWRGFLLDHRSLRALAVPPQLGLPPSPLATEYQRALAGLEKKTPLSADEQADLGALYLRLGKPARAVEVLRLAQRQHPAHFRIAANLGTAWQLHGDLDQSAEALSHAVRLAPKNLRAAEELHLKLVRARRRPTDRQSLDDLLGVRWVGPSGQWQVGQMAPAEREKLPTEALALVQRLALALPADGRLLWQLGELANATGDVRSAAAIFEGLVSEFAFTMPEVRDRRQRLRAAADALPPADRSSDAKAGHEGHLKPGFRSPRALVRRFDRASLPEPRAGQTNPLPWALLGETSIDQRSRPTFPDYLKQAAGKTVVTTGFMQTLSDQSDASVFLLLEYPVGCWFCEAPSPTGLLLIELPEGRTFPNKRGLLKVEGRLHLNADDPENFLFTLKDARISDPD